MKETGKYIIKACQREHYTDEINMMEKKELIKNKQLSMLDLFLDAEKIICIGGRLKNSTLEYSVKHPVLLHKESYITHLLLKHFHERCEHQGRGMTISTIRSDGYCIMGVTRLVSSLIFRCVTC